MDPLRIVVAAALEAARDPVYVGFSGGLDSSVLLHAAAAAPHRDVVAVHVDHGLHPASGDWRRHCAAAAAAAGVALVSRRVQVAAGAGIEARARDARYRVFAELLADGGTLLLAHHRDDQAETGLLRLLQGRGLYGMPAARPLAAGTLLRPLLDVPRSVLAEYAARHRLGWVEDPANADERMDRSFLRHRILPRLRERWPDVDQALLDALAERREADALAAAGLGEAAGAGRLPLARLSASTAPATLLRLWLQSVGLAVPSRAALQEFARQALTAATDRCPSLVVHGDACLRRHRDAVYLVRPAPALDDVYPMPVPGRLRLPHGLLCVEPAAAGMHPRPPVEVRFRRGGEQLRRAGRRRSLKQLFQAAGVPPWLRDRHPLLVDAGGLLAVPGLAVRDPAPTEAAAAYAVRWLPDAAA